MTHPYQEPIRVTGSIERMLETSTAFATRSDNGQKVYVRSAIARLAGVQTGNDVSMLIVPNKNSGLHQDCPWFALRIERLSDSSDSVDIKKIFERGSLEPKPTHKRDLFSEATDFLSVSGPSSTGQIANALGVPTNIVRPYLMAMNDRGEIAKADVYARGKNQSRASFSLWAVNIEDLVPSDE